MGTKILASFTHSVIIYVYFVTLILSIGQICGQSNNETNGEIKTNIASGPGCPTSCTCTATRILCDDVEINIILPFFTPELIELHLKRVDFEGDILDPVLFTNASGLGHLALIDCDLEEVKHQGNQTSNNPHLYSIDLTQNDIEFYNILTELSLWWPSLTNITLDHNDLQKLSTNWQFASATESLTTLSLKYCELQHLPNELPVNLAVFQASHNEIDNIQGFKWPEKLTFLDLSYNKLSRLTNETFSGSLPTLKTLHIGSNEVISIQNDAFSTLGSLAHLDISSNPIEDPIFEIPPALKELKFTHTKIRYFNVSHMASMAPVLEKLDISYNEKLVAIVGNLAKFQNLQSLNFKNCSLRSLDNDFFGNLRGRPTVDVTGNPFQCNCSLIWALDRPEIINLKSLSNCLSDPNSSNSWSLADLVRSLDRQTMGCDSIGFGDPGQNGSVVRFGYGLEAVVHCDTYGSNKMPIIEWRRHSPPVIFGKWIPDDFGGRLVHFESDFVKSRKYQYQNIHFYVLPWVNKPTYVAVIYNIEILPGGALLINPFKTGDIERYYCTINDRSWHSANESLTMLFYVRQDLDNWFDIEILSYFVGMGTTMAFFALYMIWSAVRKFIVWRINEMEKSTRMQNMIDALEKYRQRQMEVLQERYVTGVQAVRDQYAAQVDQVQRSYAMQAGRLKDYRATRIEQLATMRDGYNQQMCRVREYGADRMERLWESYERQMNRIRTFSLQSRLRLQRQHKISQRYLKKLYTNPNDVYSSPAEPPQLPESTVDLALPFLEPDLDLGDPRRHVLDRIFEDSPDGSFHSLPDWGDPPWLTANFAPDSEGSSTNRMAPPDPQGSNSQGLLPRERERRKSAHDETKASTSSFGGPSVENTDRLKASFWKGHRRTTSSTSGKSSELARPMQVRLADHVSQDNSCALDNTGISRAPLQTLHDETAL